MKPYYDDGRGIQIFHGDCREVLPSLPKCDLVLTDPPYGIKRHNQKQTTGGNGGRKEHVAVSNWDDKIPSAEIFKAVLAAGDKIVIWGGQFFADILPAHSKWFVWNKEQRINQSDGELAWTNMEGALRICDMNRVELLLDGTQHPTQKPLKLMTWCIKECGDVKTIVDPFCGSGTTLRAAKDLGVQAIGVELSEEYCEVSARRLQQDVLAL